MSIKRWLITKNTMINPSREKELAKRFLPRGLISFFRKVLYPEKINLIEDNLHSLFCEHYQKIAASDLAQKIAMRNAEFKVYSKNGGDGLLLHIFSKIGVTNRTFIEMGVEQGRECNTANLSLNFGWKGMIVDANERWMESAKNFYRERLGQNAANVKAVTCFITAENINETISQNDIFGEIDLLSIDIDGNDYWILKAINAVNPRVIVAEYNASFGLKPITVKYTPDMRCQRGNLHFGASLTALTKLANSKGYILIGCDSQGHDAFFVRKDVAQGRFIEVLPNEAFYPNPHLIKKIGSIEKQFALIKHLNFEEI